MEIEIRTDREERAEAPPPRGAAYARAGVCAMLVAGAAVIATGALASSTVARTSSVSCPVTTQEIKSYLGLTVTRSPGGYANARGVQCSFSTAALQPAHIAAVEVHLQFGMTKAAITNFFKHSTYSKGTRVEGLGDQAYWIHLNNPKPGIDLSVAKGTTILDIYAVGRPLSKIEALAKYVLPSLK